MNRTELLEKLERVAPALSGNDLVPILKHFWFKDGTLMAYNNLIGISTTLKSDFEGAIPDTLISLLNVSRAKDVEFFVGKDDVKKALPEGTLLLKAASSKLKLPFKDKSETTIFEMPKPDVKSALSIDINEFIAALESCSRSLKEDTSMPDSMGITLCFNKGFVSMYATNNATLSYAEVELKNSTRTDRLVISGEFCRQMLSLSKLDGMKQLEIHDDYSLFRCGDNILFGSLVDVARPLDFDAVIDSSFPKKAEQQLATVPTKLELILDRAIIITESKTDRPKTEITVKDGIAKFFSQSEKGEVRDSMQVEENHPEVAVNIDPRLFKNGYGAYDKFLLTENCLVMSKGSSLYLVSASH